jgi:hypothetical protein
MFHMGYTVAATQRPALSARRAQPRYADHPTTTDFIVSRDYLRIIRPRQRNCECITESNRVRGFNPRGDQDVIRVRRHDSNRQGRQPREKFLRHAHTVPLGQDVESFGDIDQAHHQLDSAGLSLFKEMPD